MRHEIPTHLTVEDKILGPLTTRQLLFLAIGLSIGYGVWKHLDAVIPIWELRLVLGIIPFIISLAFAFIRPYGFIFEDWLFAVLRFRVLPKQYVWRPREGAAAHVEAVQNATKTR